MAQPLCRCCAKPIAKATCTVYIEKELLPGQRDWAHARHIAVPDGVRTKAECQKLTNGQVLAVKRGGKDGETIRWFTEWDGASYKDELFCTIQCAARFGRMAALHNAIETKAYAAATATKQEA